ncbi:MAG: hypothetical protein WBA76_07610 [Phormidesmis sp.]
MKVHKASTLKTPDASPYSRTLAGKRLADQNSTGQNSIGQSRQSQKNQRRDRRSSPLKLLVMSTVGFALALMTWEGILRLTVEVSQGISDHPALGKIDSPGPMLHTREGFNRTRLNSLGMRAAEPSPKQPGDYRILMLGDSFTRADEVSDGLNFSDRLQASFSSAQPTLEPKQPFTEQVQVINAGKPSASPAGYLYAASFHNQISAPDSTVIQLTEADFTLDMESDRAEFYLKKKGKADYEIVHNPEFGSAEPLAQAVIEYAPWLRSLMQLSTLRVGGRNLSSFLSPIDSSDTEEPTPIPTESKRLQAEDAAIIRWTVQQLNQHFPHAVLLFIPAMNYKDAGEISSDPRNAAIEKTLTEATAAQGVPFLNMRPDFRAYYRTKGTNLSGFNNTVPGQGHLNPIGHALVAQRLINFYSQSNSPLRKN